MNLFLQRNRTQLTTIFVLIMLVITTLSVHVTFAQPAQPEDPTLLEAENVVGLKAEDILNFDALDRDAEITLYVNQSHANASDNNPGTSADAPLKKIKRAIAITEEYNKQNKGVKILIYPGTYRESIEIFPNYQHTNATIIFEGQTVGAARIVGSKIYTNWTAVGSTGIYSIPWTNNWGLAAIPDNWESVSVPTIVRRREMVYINGQRQTQVLNYNNLTPGTFFVDEGQNKLFIKPSGSDPIANLTIEVSDKPHLLDIYSRQNIVVRGLVFSHASTNFESGVQIMDSSNILVENSTFKENNWGGLDILNARGAVTRGNTYSYNGGYGYNAWRTKDLLSENDTATYNDWRGLQGNFTGWAIAGVKHLMIHNGTYRNLNTSNNSTKGFWLDTDMRNIVIDNVTICNNLDEGIYFENNPGYITMKNSRICNNKKSGLLVANSENFRLQNNIFYGNSGEQIMISGIPNRTDYNWETGASYTNQPAEHVIMTNNVLMSKNNNQVGVGTTVSTTQWNIFVNALTSWRNTWYNKQGTASARVYGQTWAFDQWVANTKNDSTSVFGDVLFENADGGDFDVLGYTTPGTGTGLKGEYFNNSNLTSSVLTRTDGQVNFNWGAGSPDAAVDPESFSARWVGEIEPTYTETYKFTVVSDDGVRLWVNNQLVIADWTGHTALELIGEIRLVAGKRVPIRLEYFEGSANAQIEFYWESAHRSKELVPTSRLYPTTTTIQGAVELIGNGNFETNDNGDKLPDGWTGSNLGNKDMLICNSSGNTVAFRGNCAFQFKVAANKTAGLTYKTTLASPVAATGVNLGVYVKSPNVRIEGSLKGIITYTNGQKAKVKVLLEPDDSYYNFVSAGVPLNGTIESVKVKISYSSRGIDSTLTLDMITMVTNNGLSGVQSVDGLVALPEAVSTVGSRGAGKDNTTMGGTSSSDIIPLPPSSVGTSGK